MPPETFVDDFSAKQPIEQPPIPTQAKMPHDQTALVKSALADFRRSVEITRDVRFQANLRLARRQRSSSYIVSLLSLYVIALSLIPNVMSLHQYQSQILLGSSIILSVFVIFTSLIDGAQNFYHQGELLHQCARKVADVNHKLKNIDIDADPSAAMVTLKELQEDYRKALDDCPTNHDNVDFYAEQARKPHLFPSEYYWPWKFTRRTYLRVKVAFLTYSYIVPPLAAGLVVSLAVYRYVIIGSAPIDTH